MSNDPIIRFSCLYMVLFFGSLLLGIGVFEIVFGLMILVTRILVRWSPMQRALTKFFGFKSPELVAQKPVSNFYKATAFLILAVISTFYAAVSIFFIQMGVRSLFEGGFLNQNLIYNLFFR